MASNFWLLDSPEKSQADWGSGMLWRASDYPSQVAHGIYTYYGGPAKRLTELRVVLDAKKPTDFIWTISNCMIQDRVVEMLRDSGFTGFETRPATVGRETEASKKSAFRIACETAIVKDDAIPPYSELTVTGWGGVVGPESGLHRLPDSLMWDGYMNWEYLVDEDQWDGSDFFIVWPYPLYRVVTDRVASFIRKHRITGCRLIQPRDFKHPCKFPIRGATPGSISDWMPDGRAKELGEPLGIY